MIKHIFISAMIICSIGCTIKDTDDGENKVQIELQRKIDIYLAQQREDCLNNAILEAEIYIDSVIYELSQFNILDDSIKMITKPFGPSRPDYLKIKDTSAIIPFKIDTTSKN